MTRHYASNTAESEPRKSLPFGAAPGALRDAVVLRPRDGTVKTAHTGTV